MPCSCSCVFCFLCYPKNYACIFEGVLLLLIWFGLFVCFLPRMAEMLVIFSYFCMAARGFMGVLLPLSICKTLMMLGVSCAHGSN
jgi:hypothetical protein